MKRAILGMLAMATVAAMASCTAASAQPASQAAPAFTNLMAGQPFLIKANDLAAIGGTGTYQWVACGLTTNPMGIITDPPLPCLPGQDPVYTSFYTMRDDIFSGKLVSGDTIIFDQEGWTLTPAYERAHPQEFLQRAGDDATAHGITIIETPTGTSATQQAIDVTAAQHSPVIDLQDQYLDGSVSKYIATVKANVAAVRAVSKTVVILAGLAPDAGGRPITVAKMLAEYDGVKGIVQGFWLNSAQWVAPKGIGCAPVGCPAITNAFIAAIQG